MLTRDTAIQQATDQYDSGRFLDDLQRRVALLARKARKPTAARACTLICATKSRRTLTQMGFTCRIVDNPAAGAGPFLVGHRHEGDGLPTVLTYGHGDVVRGYDAQWREAWDRGA